MFPSPNFWIFDALFHSAIDLFYLVIGWGLVMMVSKTQWKAHLKWLVPSALSSTLVALYRLIVNIQLVGMPWTHFTYALRLTLLYLADIAGVYGAMMLYQIWKQSIGRGESGHGTTEAPLAETHNIWPPPPTRPA